MVKEFLKKQILDLRIKGKSARPFDQKLTADVVYAVCSIIYKLTKNNNVYKNSEIINSKDLAAKATQEFGKPAPDKNTANEYDKFVGQTTQMLIYSGIVKRISSIKYMVINPLILYRIIHKEIISTIDFLYIYFKEVFKQSSFTQIDAYVSIQNPTTQDYINLRDSFTDFINFNTKIKKTLEPRRIIAKPLNLIAYKEKAYGSNHGGPSKGVILLTDILYARKNSRDSYKKKDIPRRIAKKNISKLNDLKAMENKIKRYVKFLSNNLSDMSNAPATQAHHILPKHQYPEFIATPENIIILTPNEHLLKAHPNNNTKEINSEYQLKLLEKKKKIIENNPNDYNIESFNNMLSIAKIDL